MVVEVVVFVCMEALIAPGECGSGGETCVCVYAVMGWANVQEQP